MKKTVYFILLSAATFLISCASNTTGIDAYTETLYKPSYASGFEIVGAEGRQSTLLKVFNPWQGAENTETTLFIVRNGEKIPAGFTGQVVKAGARRIVCLYLCGDARCVGTGRPGGRSFGKKLYFE